jgi:protoporphyrinogen oxidase
MRPIVKKKSNGRIGILGGGLAGLAFGAAMEAKGISYTVFEANETVGGLARTFTTDGYRWDLGVHALYSREASLVEKINNIPLKFQHCRRNVKICHVRNGRIYPLDYPFENGLGGLPEKDLRECLEGYKKAYAEGRKTFANLADWINNGLGSGFSRIFMTPYNRKIWNAPLDEISMDLVSGKIEPQPYEEILQNAMGGNSVGRAYQARFVYPENGIQSLCDHFAGRCNGNVRTSMRITEIMKNGRDFSLNFHNGRTVKGFSGLVSTIPLKELVKLLPYHGPDMRVDRLRHNNTLFVLVGLRSGARFNFFGDCHWSFFAGDEAFYRLTMMHTFSDLFPQACVAEYTVKEGESVNAEEHMERVVRDLRRRDIVSDAKDIQTVVSHLENYTYPIPVTGEIEEKRRIRGYLSERGIDLLGRNGRWDYMNMDQILKEVDILQAEY